MILKKAVNVRLWVGIALTIMALIAFNMSRPGLERTGMTSFNQWYQGTATRLTPNNELKDSDLALKIHVALKNAPSRGTQSSSWELPARSLLDPAERENIARVLQLIKESGLFGLKPLRALSSDIPSVSVWIKDGDQIFETAVSLDSVRDNIQLMNLVKLLEVYSNPSHETEETQEEPELP